MPEPITTPQRNGSSLAKSMPESVTVFRGGEGELREPVEPLELLGVGDVLLLGLPRHLAAELNPIPGDVEERDRTDAAIAAHDPIPKHFDRPAEGGHDSQTGDNSTSFHSTHRQPWCFSMNSTA
jgi:hypothetical protein